MKSLTLLQTLKLSGQLVTQISSLARKPYMSRKQIEAYQLERLKLILDVAKKNVSHYQQKNLLDPSRINSLEDWQQLPVLTKQDLLNLDVPDRINRNFKTEDLIVSKSSGSTGKALDVFYDEDSYNFFILAGLRLYFMVFKYLPWHKQTYIYTSPYPLKSLFGAYPLNFISTLNPIDDTIDKLKKNPPDLLVCYPSHLRAIAAQLTEEDLKIIRPKAINVNSEMSSQAERNYLEKVFKCFVFDDYSSEELTRIASQCRNYSYHIFEDLNYIEILDDNMKPVKDGVVGNIVGTNLHNIGMPLIRYMQGDRGAIVSKKCECGRNFKILETLEGRKNDAFTLSTGEVISSGFLLDLTYGVFLNYPNSVSAFCLIQEEHDNWTIELVPGEKWDEKLKTLIPEKLSADLKKSNVTIRSKVVSEVRKTKSGKANPIISDLKKENK
ncbi:MAG: phenylacetate--CoA ligase family protein [Bdellovibrionales bacterium]|nr:phenylacetate--CoA ligase family protein [Bdellovibrionales bacterium]